jgi:hypothetical protein
LRYVKRREVTMFRVVNSLGPFFSSSKIMCMSVGKRVLCSSERWWRARAVVQRALRQSRTSCRRASSCSSL